MPGSVDEPIGCGHELARGWGRLLSTADESPRAVEHKEGDESQRSKTHDEQGQHLGSAGRVHPGRLHRGHLAVVMDALHHVVLRDVALRVVAVVVVAVVEAVVVAVVEAVVEMKHVLEPVLGASEQAGPPAVEPMVVAEVWTMLAMVEVSFMLDAMVTTAVMCIRALLTGLLYIAICHASIPCGECLLHDRLILLVLRVGLGVGVRIGQVYRLLRKGLRGNDRVWLLLGLQVLSTDSHAREHLRGSGLGHGTVVVLEGMLRPGLSAVVEHASLAPDHALHGLRTLLDGLSEIMAHDVDDMRQVLRLSRNLLRVTR